MKMPSKARAAVVGREEESVWYVTLGLNYDQEGETKKKGEKIINGKRKKCKCEYPPRGTNGCTW